TRSKRDWSSDVCSSDLSPINPISNEISVLFSMRVAGVDAFSSGTGFSSTTSEVVGSGIESVPCVRLEIQLTSVNVTIKTITINKLKLHNIVSVSGFTPIKSSKKCPSVAIKSGADAESPPCQSKNPL